MHSWKLLLNQKNAGLTHSIRNNTTPSTELKKTNKKDLKSYYSQFLLLIHLIPQDCFTNTCYAFLFQIITLKSVQISLPQDCCRRKSGRIKFYFLSFFYLVLLLRNKTYFKFYTEFFSFGIRDEDFFNESTFLDMYIIVYSHRAVVHSRKCRAVYKFSSKGEVQRTREYM